MKSFGLVIPTLNAAAWLPALLSAIQSQTVKPSKFLVLDSSSDDDTAEICRQAGAEVIMIRREDFDHGRTRQVGMDQLGDLPFVIYLTQDAAPADPEAFANLLSAFDDDSIGVAYGRQLPRKGAKAIEAHARLFNYPDRDATDSIDTMRARGVRASFCSNSFAAYRAAALKSVDGFPANCIFGEDAVVATKMMLNGWKKRYVSSARVHHSHDYRHMQEFRRYFDVGVMHASDPELWSQFGSASGEGAKFVLSELKYLARRDIVAIPSAVTRTALKLAGYRAGKAFRRLPTGLPERLSMHRSYWRRQPAAETR